MGKIIIGIHGLGNKPGKALLERWWQESMMEGLKSIDPTLDLPHFELVYWADILNEKTLDPEIMDKENPLYLDERYVPASNEVPLDKHPVKEKIFQFLEKNMDKYFLNNDLSLNYAYISDSIIKKYFHEVDVYFTKDCDGEKGKYCRARDLIKQRTIDVLKKYATDDILLITHSMGSIIAYDILTFLLPDIEIDTFITMGSPLGLPFIIGKIAEDENFKLSGNQKLKAPPGIVNHWYNFADADDKIAFDKTLNDDYATNDRGIQAIDFLVENNFVSNGERNPHKSFGYLRNPDFAEILVNFIRKSGIKNNVPILQKMKNFFLGVR